jgi:hypothetical protein
MKKGLNQRVIFFFLILLFVSKPVKAANLERAVWFDMGFGVPQTMSIEAQVRVFQRWQLGLGYGVASLVASNLGLSFPLPTQTGSLATGETFTMTPIATPTTSLWTPFLRFYPGEDNFYFQFSYNLFTLDTLIDGTLTEQLSGIEAGLISAKVTLYQPLATVGIGNVYMSKIFFFNISIGATFIMTPWTTVTMSSLIPDVFGGNAGNQVLLDSLNSSFQTTVRNSVDLIRNQLFLIPSIQLAFGFLI